MKYAVYIQHHVDVYVVDIPPNDEGALLQALWDMDAPILVESVEQYLDDCYREEPYDEDGHLRTEEEMMEVLFDSGEYDIINGWIVDCSLFIAQPMPPNLEAGYYPTEDDMKFSAYKGVRR